MKDKIIFDGQHYEVSLPVTRELSTLPNNFSIAKKRFTSLVSRLKSKPDVFNHYNNVIKEQVDAGIVEVEFPQHCSRTELKLQSINENDSMKVLGITW